MQATGCSSYPVETGRCVPRLPPEVCIRDLTFDAIQLADGAQLADLRVLAARRADSPTNAGYGAWPHSGVLARLGKRRPRDGALNSIARHSIQWTL